MIAYRQLFRGIIIFLVVCLLAVGFVINIPSIFHVMPSKPYRVSYILSPNKNFRLKLEDYSYIVLKISDSTGLSKEERLGVFSSQEDLSFKWVSDDIIEISFSKAKILHFTNYYEAISSQTKKPIRIKIRLKPLTENSVIK